MEPVINLFQFLLTRKRDADHIAMRPHPATHHVLCPISWTGEEAMHLRCSHDATDYRHLRIFLLLGSVPKRVPDHIQFGLILIVT